MNRFLMSMNGVNMAIKYLHSMIRVSDPDATIAFFKLIGLEETRRFDNAKGKFTLIFLAASGPRVMWPRSN